MQDKQKKDALQATKEIVVKFIECGKISTNSFAENFPKIYNVVLATINQGEASGVEQKEEAVTSSATSKANKNKAN